MIGTPLTVELSNETIKVLKESLRRYPRNHVFVGRNGRPYESNDAYGKFVERTFLELFGKATGPSLWRHIFISEKVKADASEDKLEEITNLMLHGVNQQRRYRFADKEGKKACVCDEGVEFLCESLDWVSKQDEKM